MPDVTAALHVGDGQAVASGLRPVDFYIYIEAFGDPFGEKGSKLGKRRKNPVYLSTNLEIPLIESIAEVNREALRQAVLGWLLG